MCAHIGPYRAHAAIPFVLASIDPILQIAEESDLLLEGHEDEAAAIEQSKSTWIEHASLCTPDT